MEFGEAHGTETRGGTEGNNNSPRKKSYPLAHATHTWYCNKENNASESGGVGLEA